MSYYWVENIRDLEKQIISKPAEMDIIPHYDVFAEEGECDISDDDYW